MIADFATMPVEERNILRLLFTNEEYCGRIGDWEGVAQRVLAQLRGSHSQYHDDALLSAFILELKLRSPEFARW